MNTTVFKYELQPLSDTQVNLPIGHKLLHVAAQGDSICVWVEVDPDLPKEYRRFVVIGTGHGIPPCLVYLGTALMDSGQWVFHVYTEEL